MAREGKAKVLNPEEFNHLEAVVSKGRHALRNLALLAASFGMGLRAKEIAALDIQDVMSGDTMLEVLNLSSRMTKGGKRRPNYFLKREKIRKAFMDYIGDRREGPLFLSQWGCRFYPNSLQQVFARMYREAGIKGAKSHSGRRTFCTRLIEAGIDIKAVSQYMGHSSIAMTADYVENNPVRLMRLAESVNLVGM